MEQENENHNGRDDHLLTEGNGERPNRFVDQASSIVDDLNFDTFQAGFDLLDFFFDAFDDVAWVFTESHHNHASNRFRAIQVDGTAAEFWPELDVSQITNPNRNSVTSSDHRCFNIFDGLSDIVVRSDETTTSNDVFHAARLDRFGTHIKVRFSNSLHELVERDLVETKSVRVDFNLILPDITAHAGDFTDARNGLQFIFHHKVLQASKFRQVGVFSGLKRVIKNLAETGRIGSECRRDAFRQSRGCSPQLFRHSGPGPIKIRMVFECDLDKAVAEQALAANGFCFRDSEHRDRERVGNLIFDVLGRSARP